MTTESLARLKTIHNPADRADLAARINTLQPDSAREWGKMTAAQMMQHCELFDKWIQKGDPNRQTLMGKIVGRPLLRRTLNPNIPMAKNLGTMPELMPQRDPDFAAARESWLASLENYVAYDAQEFVHDFFGPMNYEEVGAFVWKHADHHLKQFGV